MVSPQIPTSMMNLPNELLSDIFIKLLAKQIAQMRCVCKPWNALLSESSFVKSHLHRSIQHNDEILLVFYHEFSFNWKPFTTHLSQSPGLESTNDIRLPVNPQSKYPNATVTGSVNGLICFYYKSYDGDYVIHIWNPSLSAVLTLPPFSLPSRGSEKVLLRFGFDPNTDDYKVVKLTSLLNPHRMVPEVEVYSMRKGPWELITQSFPSHITMIRDDDEVCVDGREGHLHWLGSPSSDCTPTTIVAFDLGAETFREIPFPDSLLHNLEDRFNVLGVMLGKLCVMSRAIYGGECEVWVMDVYGVAESWVKHQVFPTLSGNIFPYGFTSHNKFIFEVECGLYLYDPVTSQTKTFKITGRLGVFKIMEYVDSVVWVAPAEHQPSQGHPSICISKRHRLLNRLQMAFRGISRCYVS